MRHSELIGFGRQALQSRTIDLFEQLPARHAEPPDRAVSAEPARAILDVATIDVVADRGYFKIEDIEACEKAGMTPYVPKPQRGSSVSNGFFRKDEFCYDAELDVLICPAGQVLSSRYESKLRELTKIDYSNRAACLVRAIKSRCTKDYRKVSRLENEAVLDRMAARLKARPEIVDRRREMVEHPFGSIKQWMNQGAFLMKGLDNVRGLVQSDRARL